MWLVVAIPIVSELTTSQVAANRIVLAVAAFVAVPLVVVVAIRIAAAVVEVIALAIALVVVAALADFVPAIDQHKEDRSLEFVTVESPLSDQEHHLW